MTSIVDSLSQQSFPELTAASPNDFLPQPNSSMQANSQIEDLGSLTTFDDIATMLALKYGASAATYYMNSCRQQDSAHAAGAKNAAPAEEDKNASGALESLAGQASRLRDIVIKVQNGEALDDSDRTEVRMRSAQLEAQLPEVAAQKKYAYQAAELEERTAKHQARYATTERYVEADKTEAGGHKAARLIETDRDSEISVITDKYDELMDKEIGAMDATIQRLDEVLSTENLTRGLPHHDAKLIQEVQTHFRTLRGAALVENASKQTALERNCQDEINLIISAYKDKIDAAIQSAKTAAERMRKEADALLAEKHQTAEQRCLEDKQAADNIESALLIELAFLQKIGNPIEIGNAEQKLSWWHRAARKRHETGQSQKKEDRVDVQNDVHYKDFITNSIAVAVQALERRHQQRIITPTNKYEHAPAWTKSRIKIVGGALVVLSTLGMIAEANGGNSAANHQRSTAQKIEGEARLPKWPNMPVALKAYQDEMGVILQDEGLVNDKTGKNYVAGDGSSNNPGYPEIPYALMATASRANPSAPAGVIPLNVTDTKRIVKSLGIDSGTYKLGNPASAINNIRIAIKKSNEILGPLLADPVKQKEYANDRRVLYKDFIAQWEITDGTGKNIAMPAAITIAFEDLAADLAKGGADSPTLDALLKKPGYKSSFAAADAEVQKNKMLSADEK